MNQVRQSYPVNNMKEMKQNNQAKQTKHVNRVFSVDVYNITSRASYDAKNQMQTGLRQCAGERVQGSSFKMQGSKCKVQGARCKGQGTTWWQRFGFFSMYVTSFLSSRHLTSTFVSFFFWETSLKTSQQCKIALTSQYTFLTPFLGRPVSKLN